MNENHINSLKNNNYIVPLSVKLAKKSIGNKAASLQFLKKNHFKIPKTYVVQENAFSGFTKHEKTVLEQLRKEIERLPEDLYAVRSSTNLEDAADFSHAGQFETFLNVRGKSRLLDAVVNVWKSAIPKDNDTYFKKTGSQKAITCAVIIQKMVDSKLAGVSFSKNPVNNLHETIIEAVEGSGENLVQKGETPVRWVYKKGKLVKGEAAYKEIKLIEKIAQTTAQLKKKFHNDVDIEWAYDGTDLYFLQIRSVTANTNLPIYSNKMAKEMLPGQIKPLVWSLNIPLVNGTWIELLEKVIGKSKVKPEDLAKSFYYRTYFNVTNLAVVFAEFGVPFESIEEMMLDENKTKHTFKPGVKTIKHTFRLLKFIWGILKFEKQFLKEFPTLKSKVMELDSEVENSGEIINQFNVLYNNLFVTARKLTHFNILTPLLMRAYSKKMGEKLKKIGLTSREVDFNIDFPEIKKLSPLSKMAEIKEMFDKLPEGVKNRASTYKQVSELEETQHIYYLLQQFLKEFGHLSESGNDISHKKWEEEPEFVFEMIIESVDVKNNSKNVPFVDLKIPFLKRRKYHQSYLKAGRFALYREQISSLYIYGYGLFRKLYLKVADDFVEKGILNKREDIFYLNNEEVQEILEEKKTNLLNWKKAIENRKAEYEKTKDVILPSVIYGDEAPVVEQGSIKNFDGVSTSPGTFKGKTKVVNHISDFEKVVEGDVVIIPFSDVSWTPALVKAGAIISESGGMLSHCSIIAREMGIPAVVSVDNACSLSDNLLVTVNGSNGILTIHDYE